MKIAAIVALLSTLINAPTAASEALLSLTVRDNDLTYHFATDTDRQVFMANAEQTPSKTDDLCDVTVQQEAPTPDPSTQAKAIWERIQRHGEFF
ncbi:MAG: hypothetical protein U1F68_17335 [Gammaproteobacteria bacterium]